MIAEIVFRRGTEAEWISADPILSAGEPGYEVDTGGLKIGNGADKWTLLDYTILTADLMVALNAAVAAAQATATSAVSTAAIAQTTAEQAALDAAEAVATNDTIIGARIRTPSSESRAALKETYIRFTDQTDTPITDTQRATIKVNTTTGAVVSVTFQNF